MPIDTVDSSLALVIEDLDVLREVAPASKATNEAKYKERQHVLQAIAIYLVTNRQLIDRAVEAWANTPENELRELEERTRELDYSATTHSFLGIGTSALVAAHETLVNPLPVFFQITDDGLHMLDRLVRFGNHLVDTRGLPVVWHPVRDLLGLPELPVDQARDQALAVAPSPLWTHRITLDAE